MTARDVRYRAEYAGVLCVRGLVRVLPDSAVRVLGRTIGAVWAMVDGRHRRLAADQLHAAFPSRSIAECRRIARATFGHFGELFVVLLKFSTLTTDQMRARVEFDGHERVRDALALGKGVLLFSGHFGFWELQGMAHSLALPAMSVLARPLDNPFLHALLERARTQNGNHVIYKKGAVRRVLRALAANECVAIMIDQHTHSADAVAVDFFNRPAATTSALAAMALRTGAPVIPVFALPLPDGRFRMVYEHPVERPAVDAADPVGELMQRCTDVVEMHVRRDPQMWLWLHRRWRLAEGEAIGSGARTPAEADEIDALSAPDMTPINRVVVRPPNWLGDAVLALPAIAAIRRHFPSADLTIAAPPAVAAIFREDTDVRPDAVIDLPNQPHAQVTTIASLRADLAVLFPNSFRSAWTMRQAGVPARWGYARAWRGWLLTRIATREKLRGVQHQADYYRGLVRGLGLSCGDDVPRLGATAASRAEAVRLFTEHKLAPGTRVIAFAPGAAYGQAKQWPPERVAALIARLLTDRTEPPVSCVIVGAEHDRPAARAIESWLSVEARDAARRVINLTGRTSVNALAGVLALSDVLVTNDSGAMHLASALGRPVVAIFGPTDERATRPLGTQELVTADVFCRPCLLRDCPIDHRCMTRITVDTVFAATSRQLARAGADAHPEAHGSGRGTLPLASSGAADETTSSQAGSGIR